MVQKYNKKMLRQVQLIGAFFLRNTFNQRLNALFYCFNNLTIPLPESVEILEK